MTRFTITLVCKVLVISILATQIIATTHVVGDSNGWTLGVDYNTWASTKTFKVGDSLMFNYRSSHSVSEVSSSEYMSCNLRNALSADRSGATTFTLNTAGQHYFVCGAPGHCDGGQKLVVTVAAADTVETFGSPATSPLPRNIAAPETPSTTANAPTFTKNNDVPHSSSATSLSPIVATIFVMACGVVMSRLIV